MGYNNQDAARLIFDIETAPLAEAAEYIEPAEAPANYKDPVKIAEYIASKTAEQIDKCGLDVDLCRVVALGFWIEGTEEPLALTLEQSSEADLLRTFWTMVATGHHLVGFNCLGFDLPVLLRRSLYLGITTPNVQIDRYKHPTVTDLMQLLSFNGTLKLRGLAFYAKRFGFNVVDELTGADVGRAVMEGRWEDVEAHVKADVRKTAMLAEKLGYFHPAQVAAVL